MAVNDSDYENQLIDSLDRAKLAEAFLPAIIAVARNRGGAEAIIKNSGALAALTLVDVMAHGKDGERTKAALEILNRDLGKPVERHLNVYADIAQLNDDQLMREIHLLAKRNKLDDVIEAVVEPLPQPKKFPTRQSVKVKAKADDDKE